MTESALTELDTGAASASSAGSASPAPGRLHEPWLGKLGTFYRIRPSTVALQAATGQSPAPEHA